MSTTVIQEKNLIASYLGRTSAADLNPSNLTPAGPNIDLGLYGLNQARLKIERAVDMAYSQSTGLISIVSTGTLLSAITGLPAGSSTKRVISVSVPIAGGNFIPVEFLTQTEYEDRVKAMIGRQAYSGAATLTGLGVTFDNPIAYQDGQTIFLAPASQFTFPVACEINVVRFLPDYATDADHDFFTDIAPDYMLWQGVLETNKLFRRFVEKAEGNIQEESVKAMADEALQAFLRWNSDIGQGTSTPPQQG